jgi:hypothetical protein
MRPDRQPPTERDAYCWPAMPRTCIPQSADRA